MPADTIVARLLRQGRERADLPAYYVKDGQLWRPTSWRAHVDEVRRAARALIALGVGPGDAVCILGFNRPEWVVMDLACMMVGGVPAGIYTTNSPSEVRYIVGHAEAAVVLVEDADQLAKIDEVRAELPGLAHVITMRDASATDALGWEDFLARGDEVDDAAVDERVEALSPDDVGTYIYTSGTTGPPKAVMLSHHNLAWTAKAAAELVSLTERDTLLSYLPLSHIAEQMFSIHAPCTVGAAIYFAESMEKLRDDLVEVQPTVFFGVPRVWEKMSATIAARLDEAPPLRRRIAAWARSVGSRVSERRMRGEPLGLGLSVAHRIADRLVFSKLKPRLGLGNARLCVSGSAPVSREVLEFFAGFDLIILEVYGQSEDTGPTTFNRPGHAKLGTVGPAIPGVEVRIADDGEIVVRGPNVFLGYAKDEEATAEVLVDGWLHSGDLGAFDDEGFLTITGRKKDILITAGGKNIAPKNIEKSLQDHPLVGDAVVIGDRRRFLSALLTLDPDAAVAFAEKRGLALDGLHEHPDLLAALQEGVDAVNRELARVENIRKFRVLPQPLSIERGELTPTLKVKRRVVEDHYTDVIEEIYA